MKNPTTRKKYKSKIYLEDIKEIKGKKLSKLSIKD